MRGAAESHQWPDGEKLTDRVSFMRPNAIFSGREGGATLTATARDIPEDPVKTTRTTLLLGLALLGAASAAPKNPNVLVALASYDWTGFDPAHCNDLPCEEVLQNTLETLYFPKGASTTAYSPMLAADQPTVSADGKTYTVKLNPQAKFSDGTPVTANDVKYSLTRLLAMSASDGPVTKLLYPLVGTNTPLTKDNAGAYVTLDKAIEVKDARTVVFHLAQPFGPFLAVLASPASAIYSQAAAAKAGAWDGKDASWAKFVNQPLADSPFLKAPPLGSGPFTLGRYDSGNQVILQRNDKYWRAPAKLQTVVIKNVAEAATAVQLLKTGDADLIRTNGYPRNVASQFAGLDGVTTNLKVNSLALQGFFMNFNVKNASQNGYLGTGTLSEKGIPADFFSDVNVRRAFASSFDYNSFIQAQLLGAGIQTNGALVKGLLGYTALHFPYSRPSALASFKKAYGGKLWTAGFTVPVFWNSGNETRHQAALVFKRNIESLNPKFHVDVREIQFSELIAKANSGQLTAYFLGWSTDYADPYNVIFPWAHSQGTFPKQTGYKNPKVDDVITQAVATTDAKKRGELYQQAAKLAYNDVAELPLYQDVGYTAQRDWVKGRVLNPLFGGNYYYSISKE